MKHLKYIHVALGHGILTMCSAIVAIFNPLATLPFVWSLCLCLIYHALALRESEAPFKLPKRKRMLFCALLVLSILLSGSITTSNSTLSGSNFITEITVGFEPKVVDVDSSGRIFIGDQNNDVWRSVDNGASWVKVLDGATSTNDVGFVYVNDLDYIFASVWITGNRYDVYRSIDHGNSWQAVHTNSYVAWNIGEMSNGTIFYNTCSTCGVYKSNDDGASWTLFSNVSSWGIEHIHWCYVSDNDDLYVATGDGQYDAVIKRYNENTLVWDTIANDTQVNLYYQTVGMTSDDTYVYFFGDAATRCYRMLHAGTSVADLEQIFELNTYTVGAGNFVFDAVRIGDVYLFGTNEGQAWGSWDGLHWVKLFDAGLDGFIYRFSRSAPIYFVDAEAKKLYRLSIQKEDLICLYYETYNALRGSVTSAETYILEQRIDNGINYVDFTGVSLSNVQAAIKGLSRTNQVLAPANTPNAGWEWNNVTGWTVYSTGGTYGTATVSNEEAANGTYSLKTVKAAGDTLDGMFREPTGTYTVVSRGEILFVSVYVKGNITSEGRLRIYFVNDALGTNLKICPSATSGYDLTTSWQRITAYYIGDNNPLNVRVAFLSMKGVDYTVYWDSILIQKVEVGLQYDGGENEESINYFLFAPFTYHTAESLTTNPSLTISEQVVSYSGTLTNGTESTTTTLTGSLSGIVEVDANIQGSNQAILRLIGTTKATSEYTPSIGIRTISALTFYMRNNIDTVNGVTGYQLDTEQTDSQITVTESQSGTKISLVGFRVWYVDSQNATTELTPGYPIALMQRTTGGSGLQSATWTPPARDWTIGWDSLKVNLYMRFNNEEWTAKGAFTTERLRQKALLNEEWTFYAYTQLVQNGTSYNIVSWGSSSYNSRIADVTFTDPFPPESMIVDLQDGDFFGFLVFPMTFALGNTLPFGVLLLMFSGTLYLRYHSFKPVLVLFILFGGSSGILTLMIPEVGATIGWVFMVFGLAGLLWQLKR